MNFADNLVSDRSIKTVAQAAERMRSKGFELTATRMLVMGEEIAKLCGEDIDLLLERVKVREAAASACDRLASFLSSLNNSQRFYPCHYLPRRTPPGLGRDVRYHRRFGMSEKKIMMWMNGKLIEQEKVLLPL